MNVIYLLYLFRNAQKSLPDPGWHSTDVSPHNHDGHQVKCEVLTSQKRIFRSETVSFTPRDHFGQQNFWDL